MVCQKKYFHWLLLSCVALTLFSGCTTNIPITKSVFNDLDAKRPVDKEPKKPEDIQYYISKKIILVLDDDPDYYTVNAGKLNITNKEIRRTVTIAKKKKGKLQFTNDAGYLVVGFEKNYPNCLIRFGQLREGNDERYYLIYDDEQKKAIKYWDKKYGDRNYVVKFEGDGSDDIDNRPYLEIKVKKPKDKDKTWRWATGWKYNE